MTSSNSYNYNDSKVPQRLFNQLGGLEPGENKERREKMDSEVRPTWRLAWGLWWRMFLISLGIGVIITLILVLVGVSLIPWLIFW